MTTNNNNNISSFDEVSLMAAFGASEEALNQLRYYKAQSETIQDHFEIETLSVYRYAGWYSCRFDATLVLKGNKRRKFSISGRIRQKGLKVQFVGFDQGVNGYYAKQDKSFKPVLKDGKPLADFSRPLIDFPVEILNPQIEELYKMSTEEVEALPEATTWEGGNIRIRSKLHAGLSIRGWKQASGKYTFRASRKLDYKFAHNIQEFLRYELEAMKWESLEVVTRRKRQPKGTLTEVKGPKAPAADNTPSPDTSVEVSGSGLPTVKLRRKAGQK